MPRATRDLSTWAHIAEIASGIAVFVTMVLLLLQVRGNTEAIRVSARQDAARNAQDLFRFLAEDNGLMELQIRRSSGDTLSASEANRVQFLNTLALRVTESQYVLHEAGLLNADDRRALRYRLAGPARLGGYLELIAQCPDCYTPQFRAWVESIVEDPAREP